VRDLRTNLVFPSQNGTRISNRNLQRAFTIALKKAKIRDFHFHDTRHTFGSRLAMAGKDIYLIKNLVGHRQLRMVERYAHHNVESLRNGIEALETMKREVIERGRGTNPSQLEGHSESG